MNNDDKLSIYITAILKHNDHHQNNYITLKITIQTEKFLKKEQRMDKNENKKTYMNK